MGLAWVAGAVQGELPARAADRPLENLARRLDDLDRPRAEQQVVRLRREVHVVEPTAIRPPTHENVGIAHDGPSLSKRWLAYYTTLAAIGDMLRPLEHAGT